MGILNTIETILNVVEEKKEVRPEMTILVNFTFYFKKYVYCVCIQYRGHQAFSGMTNNNGFAHASNLYQSLFTHGLCWHQEIVVIHSTENCHLWSGSCPHCVEWTLVNRKYGVCDETLPASVIIWLNMISLFTYSKLSNQCCGWSTWWELRSLQFIG